MKFLYKVTTKAKSSFVLFLIFCLIIFSHCTPSHSKKTNIPIVSSPIKFNNSEPINHWKHFMNYQLDTSYTLYSDPAVNISHIGKAIQGKYSILQHYKTNPFAIDSISSLFTVPATRDSSFIYEIGTLWTPDHKKYKYLIIWKSSGDQKKIEMEYFAEASDTKIPNEDLNVRRQHWIHLCNLHNAKILVQELYTPDAIYFSHKPVIVGTDLITQEYSYMNDPKYNLSLAPLIVESVNDSIIFEIGQCTGYYQGKYILIWQKMSSGLWHVMFDSNI